MKRNVLKPFLFLAALILIVGLACSVDLGGKTPEAPAPQPIVPATEAPTQQQSAPEPVAPEPPTAEPPTATLLPSTGSYFKEDFNSDVLGSWTNFITTGTTKSDKSKAKHSIENGKLTFNMTDNYLYSYLIYDGQTYDDVRVEVSFDNRGKNNNNVSLICRYSEDGWYEFNIASNGLFNILAYDATGAVHKGYNTVYSSGSTAIKAGKETNVYRAICSGRNLSLYINGTEAANFVEKKFGYTNGKVGLSVSSFNVYPIIVDIDYFDIAKP
ncbi:MAG: hypothetical protein JETCAE02_14830 [Anaerolineaceae bacterium]|nr:DUF1080 domain-containing protein [Anaerolineae bacterium]MBL1172067.1 DUF1080 domain-containing protein [Chloroflexota bacterium]MDL1925665.1 DUF1080 domain-containing protein [Anaerolineae bacterium AMX1]GJQ39071.1 MAG: hypothetical protein JETCAE02_14830 [Anaerolineaceae bacterium]HMM99596.1 DUF1080 domain-containing protein [Anaerolineales bacterium]